MRLTGALQRAGLVQGVVLTVGMRQMCELASQAMHGPCFMALFNYRWGCCVKTVKTPKTGKNEIKTIWNDRRGGKSARWRWGADQPRVKIAHADRLRPNRGPITASVIH